MGEKLKPCPFCGRQPEKSNGDSAFSRTGRVWVIYCDCDTFSVHAHQDSDTEERVIAKWNTRAKTGGRKS